ncbi:hypothetical protein I3843_12G131700 [Carya illinoinensis]|uniref:Uncharacterized protein n=1 Tax=Carya illinoinensis TaxID=32201 RepID=A0A922IWU0_CARIL|nr:hypothetical protein I3842_12G131700 [Carya illinoinensis]KAG7953877.1 hypothetical protein I3843_12G131700 [Carya illinoinensis]
MNHGFAGYQCKPSNKVNCSILKPILVVIFNLGSAYATSGINNFFWLLLESEVKAANLCRSRACKLSGIHISIKQTVFICYSFLE